MGDRFPLRYTFQKFFNNPFGLRTPEMACPMRAVTHTQ